jgi:hypothetical protein
MRHFSGVACPSSLTNCTMLWMAPCNCACSGLIPAPSYLAYKTLQLNSLSSCISVWLSYNFKLLQKLFPTDDLLEHSQFLSDNVSHDANMYTMSCSTSVYGQDIEDNCPIFFNHNVDIFRLKTCIMVNSIQNSV